MHAHSQPLRVLFVNRMASMVRGGGETFDLEMARNLAGLGCEITILTGIPLFGKALLGPEEWWGYAQGRYIQTAVAKTTEYGHSTSNTQYSIVDEGKHLNSSIANRKSQIEGITIRSPYTGWFPWDKTPGGWRLRIADFKIFEWLAARWALKHLDQFDIIQVCELPFFVYFLKSQITNRKSQTPIVMRLTAPDFYDPVGGVQKADAVIASGDTMRRIREKIRPDCHDIPNGVDVENFGFWMSDAGLKAQARKEFRSAHNVPEDAMVVTHVARFQSVKNHAMLIDAFADFKKTVSTARLILAGSGPLKEEVEGKVRQLGMTGDVIFLGEMKHADLPAVYAATDINVMPSDYESFCFAVLEGMASELPHVVTDTNWVPGLLGDNVQLPVPGVQPSGGNVKLNAKIRSVSGGLITPVGDASTFAEALRQLAHDSTTRAQMGHWCRARVEKDFCWKTSADRLKKLYASLMTTPN